MPKTAPALDITQITRIEQHPTVAPVQAHKAALLSRQGELQAELDAAYATLRQGEVTDPVAYRHAKKTAIATEESLQELRMDLVEVQRRLDVAVSTAKRDIRPMLEADAVPVVEDLERCLLTLIAVQERLQALGQKARRLGVSLGLEPCLDACLEARVKEVQRRLAKLQA